LRPCGDTAINWARSIDVRSSPRTTYAAGQGLYGLSGQLLSHFLEVLWNWRKRRSAVAESGLRGYSELTSAESGRPNLNFGDARLFADLVGQLIRLCGPASAAAGRRRARLHGPSRLLQPTARECNGLVADRAAGLGAGAERYLVRVRRAPRAAVCAEPQASQRGVTPVLWLRSESQQASLCW
jgi:hypothetical protein